MLSLGWTGIVRLGLVQTALGAIVVMMTSTINRVMVVELALPAIVPGLLVASHYAIQILRPAWGYGSDVGGRRTPWIIGGMAVLALGGTGAALATALAASNLPLGLALAAVAFLLVGVGAGAAGTSVLAMLAASVAPSAARRRRDHGLGDDDPGLRNHRPAGRSFPRPVLQFPTRGGHGECFGPRFSDCDRGHDGRRDRN